VDMIHGHDSPLRRSWWTCLCVLSLIGVKGEGMSDLRHTFGVICLTGHRAEETQDEASQWYGARASAHQHQSEGDGGHTNAFADGQGFLAGKKPGALR
jgi:hypothetical protein